MTNSVDEQRKNSAIKTLAIIGFTALVVFGVWLAVQLVQLAPSAFTSLASMAERVYAPSITDDLEITTTKTVVNTGEAFQLSWSEVDADGGFTFTYTCTEGVAALISNSQGQLSTVTCGQPYILAGRTDAEVKIVSENNRFVDVPFTIAFVDTKNSEVLVSNEDRITVVNATIPYEGLATSTTTDETTTDSTTEETTSTDDEEISDSETETETTPVVTKPSAPVVTTPAPVTTTHYEWVLPESDPNGTVDLKATYLGVGQLDGKTYEPAGTIDNDEMGALRFSVTNLGTKTSDNWTYKVELPNGQTYSSKSQTGLKPNETATITLGFTVTETGFHEFTGKVTVANDHNKANNDFAWSVRVVN